jgi:hypothetical protein
MCKSGEWQNTDKETRNPVQMLTPISALSLLPPGEEPDGKKWTPARVRLRFDVPTCAALHTFVLYKLNAERVAAHHGATSNTSFLAGERACVQENCATTASARGPDLRPLVNGRYEYFRGLFNDAVSSSDGRTNLERSGRSICLEVLRKPRISAKMRTKHLLNTSLTAAPTRLVP